MPKYVTASLLLLLFLGCSKTIYHMPSSSMDPTIPPGSRVKVDRCAYKEAKPARFDLVAFKPPDHPRATFVFRVLGLPGETIEITEKGVLVNVEMLEIPEGLEYLPESRGKNKMTLDEDEYFLLGDNTKAAKDSRFFGAIPGNRIIGKVVDILK
jgi:signal peptidase I